jgi:adenylate cyclase
MGRSLAGMGIETERKFLVTDDSWRAQVRRTNLVRQGYLSTEVDRVVRVRLVDDAVGAITVKGRRSGDQRAEFECPVPAADAAAMIDTLCLQPLIEKRRHLLDLAPGEWVVDEFLGANAGLVVAEVEYEPSQAADLPVPTWVSADVTEQDRYRNSQLVQRPYSTWK